MTKRASHTAFGDHSTYCEKAFTLPFHEYIRYTQDFIAAIRKLAGLSFDVKTVELNGPFELKPEAYDGQRAILLIHGFLTSPYVMRSLGEFYKSQGFLVRAILLPGHGSAPAELNRVTLQNWLLAARYGIESLQSEAKELHLAGFSLGATLASSLAYEYDIKSLALFAPAHAISRMAVLLPVLNTLSQYKGLSKLAWLSNAPQIDPYTYASYTAYSANEVRKAIISLSQKLQTEALNLPCFVAATLDDGTVNAATTVQFFKRQANSQSRMVLYSRKPLKLADERIQIIDGRMGKHILALSHIALTIAPHDPHYGQNGALYGKLADDTVFGEYNFLNSFNKRFRRLSYHPAFANMLIALRAFYQGLMDSRLRGNDNV